MSKSPLVSIIVPCYNGERYIRSLLESVLYQDYDSLEFIAIDDGSTDNTLNILNSYKKKFKKRNIRYVVISKENGGLVSAINRGLKEFSGDYINFIGQDDYFTNDSIKKRVDFLEKNRNIDVVWAATNVVDGVSGEIIEVWREIHDPPRKNLFVDMILHRGYVWPPAAKLVRASTFLKVNPERFLSEFDPGENIQIFLPIYYKGNNVGYIDEPLAYVTDHKDSYSRKSRDEEATRKYQLEIRDIFLDTLQKINMPSDERDKYINMVIDRYKKYEQRKRVLHKIISDKDELSQLYELDEKRFRQHYAANPNLANQNQLAAHMIFSAHSLEKSLSNDNFEVGHGFRVARKLIEFLNIYRNKGFDKYHLAYINTLSVLKAFYERHKDTKFEKEIEVIFGEWANDIKTCKSNIGGADVIPLSQKKNNDKKNFKELASGRFSVRTYSDDPVSRDDIKEAIEIAMKTPTVCNRQSIKVRAIYKKEIIEKVLEIQGGLAYYDTPPVLLLITADDNGYVGPNERNQGFIDGGLFAMSVLYALEYKKLAACPAHAMLPETLEKKIRGMLNISDSEKLITFITVGHFKEKNNIPKSFRYPAEYVLSEVDQLYNYEIVEVADEKASEHKNKDAAAEIPSVKAIAKDIIFLIKHKTRVRTRARKLVALFGRYLDSLAYRQADGAILTLTGYFNYGNVLQRYALQKFLRDHGKKFISYTDPYSAPRSIYKIGRKIKLKTPFRAIKRFIKRQRPYWYIPTYSDLYPEAKGLINVINFVNKNIWIKPFDPRDKYGCYIVGSDQVWRNWWGSKETLGYYFFNFLKDRKVKRIAYAASFGKDNIEEIMSPEDVEYVRPYIKSIDRISVREKSGIDIIKRTWSIENVVEAVDPTLLLTSADYSRLIDNSGTKNEKIQPIFAYVLDETDKISDFIQKIQNKKQQAVTKIRAHSKADKTLPPVELWLKGFRDAELVVTNSFHGMVFSVINNTDFIVVGRESGGLSRIKDFLKEYDITGRFVEEDSLDNFDVEKLESIDWSAVNRKLEHNRKMSRDWLLQSLT